jgi:UDP-2,4-diacetamido-2,4,6-trideoxy-beta-L-altropyranose hydrolase
LTRANGFNPGAIKREDHVRWFRARLRNPIGCRFFIVQTPSGIPLGQVRFDDLGGEWEISYSVAPSFRGRGVGQLVLTAGLRALGPDAGTVSGQVKPGNAPSRRIFESLGFVLRSSDPTRLVFERHSQN